MRQVLKILLRWRVPIIGFVMLMFLVRAPRTLGYGLIGCAAIASILALLATEGSWVTIVLLLATAFPLAWAYDTFGVGGAAVGLYLLFGATDLIATLLLANDLPRRRLIPPLGLALCVAGTLAVATVPVCRSEGASCTVTPSDRPVAIEPSVLQPSPYPLVRHWLIDSFGIGHRIDADHSVLLLRRAAPAGTERALPRIAKSHVEECACRWLLAEVYSDADQDFLAYGSRFSSDGVLTFHRWFGAISGTESAPGARAYTMPDEQWLRVRGNAELPCVVCLDDGRSVACPRLSISDRERTIGVHACNGAKDFDDG